MNHPAGLSTSDSAEAEISRIRAEYERRRRAIPGNFYAWDRPVNFFYHCQTARALIRLLSGAGLFPLDGRKVLDAGCGAGAWLLEFAQWGADQLYGIDLDATRLKAAATRLPAADLRCGDIRNLNWPDKSFDLVSQFTVFTSILDPSVRRAAAAEMLRVLKSDGAILWYDFRFDNPSNRNVRGIEAQEIRELFPGCRVKLTRVTLAPPLARRIVPATWTGALLLEQIPWLRTHYAAIIQPNTR